MATTLYFRALDNLIASVIADVTLGTDNLNLRGSATGWDSAALATTRGATLQSPATSTVAGPTAGVEVNDPSDVTPYEWISPPVAADVTISGTITANLWGLESSMSANVALNVVIEIIRAATTTTRNSNTLVEIVRSTNTTELGTSAAVNNFTTGMTSGSYTSRTLNRGDRLRIRVYADDSAAANMGSGFTFTFGHGGPTAAANGDSFVTFTETITFESAPSGTQLFLTNVQSGLTDAPTLVSDFTGANENPLSEGGNWANLNTSSNPLKRSSNRAQGTVASVNNASYWTPADFGPDLEAYFTYVGTYNVGGIVVRVQGAGGAATWDGYLIYSTGGGTKISVVTNGVETQLINDGFGSWASGDKLGVRVEGSTIQGWRQASGSSTWDLMVTVVDTTYSAAGKIGLWCNNDIVQFDSFFAATNSNLFTQQAWTSRGAGVVSYQSATIASGSWTAPLLTQEWYTRPLTAFTLTGLALVNLRVSASTTAASAARCQIASVDNDGTNPTVWADWCIAPEIFGGAFVSSRIQTSEEARAVNISGDDLAISDGQRLRIRIYLDDPGFAAMDVGRTVTTYFNGTSGGASGDTYLTLAQTVSEFVPTTDIPVTMAPMLNADYRV